MSDHKQLFKSTSKNGIFGIYAIINKIHLRIPLKPSVKKREINFRKPQPSPNKLN
jgi:hypothetical protein